LRSATAAFDGQAHAMVALKNLFFGDPAKFDSWNESRTRSAFEDAGGVVVEFPELLDRLVDQTATANPPVAFSEKLDGLRFGDRAELRRWLEKVDARSGSSARFYHGPIRWRRARGRTGARLIRHLTAARVSMMASSRIRRYAALRRRSGVARDAGGLRR